MNKKSRILRGMVAALLTLVIFIIFTSIFGADPLTLIKDNFVSGTSIELYFPYISLILLISLLVIYHKVKK